MLGASPSQVKISGFVSWPGSRLNWSVVGGVSIGDSVGPLVQEGDW